jgi:hypothetical protein
MQALFVIAPKLKATKCPLMLNKLRYSYYGILFNKKERIIDTINNLYESPENYAKRKKASPKWLHTA